MQTLFQILAWLHPVAVIGLTLRILSRRNAPGVALAWILLVLLVPLGGAVLYVMIGERRLGRVWIRRAEAERDGLYAHIQQLADGSRVDPVRIGPLGGPVARLSAALGGIPVMGGHRITLYSESGRILQGLIDDIEACQVRCSLEFYIWHHAGRVVELVDALLRAAGRGVRVTVLMDGLGSRAFSRSEGVARMRAAGIRVVVVLPAHALRFLVARVDLRNHRKIAVFDDRIAWTGSFNLADPLEFKQDAGVGQWIDAMVRVEGPAASVLGALTNGMAVLQRGPRLRDEHPPVQGFAPGTAELQPMTSGPGFSVHGIESILLTAIYGARRELVLTTPYFAPGDALIMGLRSAAARGVEVTLILPLKCDSRLVQFASASYFDELLSAGVRIHRFRGGLLHTKSMVVDGELSCFGTVNLDLRSFHLNFELSMLIYDTGFAQELLALQRSYLERSDPMSLEDWRARALGWRIVENAAQLAAPLI